MGASLPQPKQLLIMHVEIEIPVTISATLFEDMIKSEIKTIEIKFLYSDNLHHKFSVRTAYAIDLVNLGIGIATITLSQNG